MIIYKEFTFDSAHFLPLVPAGHKCSGMHGHTYKLVVFAEGEVQPETGWVMDYHDMKKVVEPIIQMVDHKLLNEVPGLENPTSEVLVRWFWQKIKAQMPLLSRIELKETPTSGVIYEGKG
ncbi:MAG TPA: 6-carboxytetrahydropterin synthase QueD [Sphingobacteriaceae bacterium]